MAKKKEQKENNNTGIVMIRTWPAQMFALRPNRRFGNY